MPNHRGTVTSQVETAWPWKAGRFSDAEAQDTRGAPGSRGVGQLARPRERHTTTEWSGVNPLPPILPEMPNLKPGDQGG